MLSFECRVPTTEMVTKAMYGLTRFSRCFRNGAVCDSCLFTHNPFARISSTKYSISVERIVPIRTPFEIL